MDRRQARGAQHRLRGATSATASRAATTAATRSSGCAPTRRSRPLENPVTTGPARRHPVRHHASATTTSRRSATPTARPRSTTSTSASAASPAAPTTAATTARTTTTGSTCSAPAAWTSSSIDLEYDTTPDAGRARLGGQPARRLPRAAGDRVMHNLIGTGNPGPFGDPGPGHLQRAQGPPEPVPACSCGHVPGEGRRQDTFNGNTVHTLLADYQSRTNGGNGWLRILEFSPAQQRDPRADLLAVAGPVRGRRRLEQPVHAQRPLGSSAPFTMIGTARPACPRAHAWPRRGPASPETEYEWYATVSDGAATTTGPVWSFTTGRRRRGGAGSRGADFALAPVAPNPMRDGTAQIAFELPREATVQPVRDRRARTGREHAVRRRARRRPPCDRVGRAHRQRPRRGRPVLRALQAEGRSFTRRLVVIR